ncbi:multiple sugar transport system substrate-binding protein [Kribbella sp. VKM Ac-2527]|uniref:Multiple sugar transport system substrate-binding protein n=1 Tax=Kribbella caucasensis TaxID=2512215 RepID=A0A4R6K6C1_9ACTN|nr:extracellular solute-binding protein [Kribbella sp. VKM Ac-2527]TDO45029.1 multiple sugar transport system substrate-binding protein [Kribbella sp. VKM Ac-2527]
MNEPTYLSRRGLLWLTAVAAAAAACGDTGDDAGPPEATVPAPSPTFTDPTATLSGDLKILLWSHFVPSHDEWFDPFAKSWGQQAGVNVTVDHINNTEIVARTAAEIQARQGHDLIQYIAPLSQFEPSVVDLKDVAEEAGKRHGEQLALCVKSSQNPATGKHYAYSPGWVPDPGDYRKSLWESVGLANGPTSWEDLLRGGAEIKKSKNIQMGLGMSQEIDSNMAGRALMWSYGASIQNQDEQVVINSPETVAAVEFMQRLFKDTMTNEVFSWNPASNNQGLIAGQMSYILNSISAWRTAQEANPEVADDIYFTPALKGPKAALAAQHVMYNWIVPSHARNVDAAKEFLLHYTANWASATYHSKLYDLPAFPALVPQLSSWLDKDPFGAQPANKLTVLKNAIEWSTNIGYPGPANTAEGEVFATFVIPNMFAKAARGELSPEQAVADAERQIKPIFDKWRRRGLVGGA